MQFGRVIVTIVAEELGGVVYDTEGIDRPTRGICVDRASGTSCRAPVVNRNITERSARDFRTFVRRGDTRRRGANPQVSDAAGVWLSARRGKLQRGWYSPRSGGTSRCERPTAAHGLKEHNEDGREKFPDNSGYVARSVHSPGDRQLGSTYELLTTRREDSGGAVARPL
jgi:hypothetical protein